ncbi:hypothetical protein FEM48_Zijuj03G0109300 [Ziziphus jujuba var. spinosa]|uniref:GDSL esterase/lipase At2g40250-like n=1 Tax=Ziziphus jujuba var. spinosa TaxID=714518 RepID=A0A978VPW7_ZIZJJ|nr:hypothetical protein FEM48_Zijuj03G0109300 [Ziziphus jujuba var. spinosa]
MEEKNPVFLVSISFAFLISFSVQTINASPSIPSLYAFGDSTLDSGNNDGLNTLFHSNHPPYGRDFPGHLATGRFSNGKLATDYMVSNLGLKELLPAYLDRNLTGGDLLTGVSFASAGSGLDELTIDLTKAFDMWKQLDYFHEALRRIKREVGGMKSRNLVEKALFVISVGTNDMLFNYYDLPRRRLEYSVSEYQDFLLQELESFIRRLHRQGARRFAVAGLPPIGCLPMQVTLRSVEHMLGRVCVEQQNNDSRAYNTKLQLSLLKLQVSLHKAKIVYLDAYNVMMDMFTNPHKYGFDRTLEGCCGTGLIELGPLCNELVWSCSDASKYIFWDSVHPTQAAYLIIANAFQKTVLSHFNH